MLTVRSAAKAPPAFRYALRWPSAASCKIPFVQLERDGATDEFLEKAVSANRLSWLRTRLHRVLRRFRSDFDVNGLLDAYPLHLLSTQQLSVMLAEAGAPPRFEAALDIGAGVGLVTDQLRPLCGTVTTVETSKQMAKRLREKGYECWEGDVAQTVGGSELQPGPAQDAVGTFDLVALLNVIDRSPAPAGLLRCAHRLLHFAVRTAWLLCHSRAAGGGSAAHRLLDAERGWFLLATPLPYRPFYYDGARTHAPLASEALDLPRARRWRPDEKDDEEWGTHAQALLERVLPAHGFRPVAFSRLPYISAGDADADLAFLDDLLVLCRLESNEGGEA